MELVAGVVVVVTFFKKIFQPPSSVTNSVEYELEAEGGVFLSYFAKS